MGRLLFFVLILVVGSISAQPSIQWQKALGGSGGDDAASIQQTEDGGYIVTGFSTSNNGNASGWHGGSDFWVVKLNQSGQVQWQKMLGGAMSESAKSIQQTTDGGYILAGRSNSNDGDVTANLGGLDYWVVKLAHNGTIEWERSLGGSEDDTANSIRQTNDGGFIIAGNVGSTDGDVGSNNGGIDFWIVKLSHNGQTQWEKCFGGSSAEYCNTIIQTSDGGYIAAGETWSNDGDVSGNNGNTDMWVVKIDSLGNLEWQNALGGIGIESAYAVQENVGGGYIVVGLTASGNTGDVTGHHGAFDFWVVKLNTEGILEWQKPLGGSSDDWGRSIVQTSEGGYVVAGETRSTDGDISFNDGNLDWWVVKLGPTGEILWDKTLGGTNIEACRSMQQTIDGGFILAGQTYSNDGDVTGFHGGIDFWVVKLNPESTPTNSPQAQALEIHPNPTTQSITIQVPEPETTLSVSITDLLGRELSRQSIPNGGTLELEGLADGVYWVTATTDSGRVFLGKVWKQE